MHALSPSAAGMAPLPSGHASKVRRLNETDAQSSVEEFETLLQDMRMRYEKSIDERVQQAIQEVDPGDEVTVEVERDGSTQTLKVPTTEMEGRTVVGVGLATMAESDVDVTVHAGAVGGPSAGMMLALGMIALSLTAFGGIGLWWQGNDFGGLTDVDPPVRFGFGSTPKKPAMTLITTTIDER